MLNILAFAAFDLWLLALPLEGCLLADTVRAGSLFYFLPPLALALLAGGRYLTRERLAWISRPSIALTLLLTLLCPWIPTWQPLLLVTLGVTAAPFLFKAFAQLKTGPRALQDAAFGIILGNLLLWGIEVLPLAIPLRAALVALPLMITLRQPLPDMAPRVRVPLHYLLLILLYQSLGGLMYGSFLPTYVNNAYLPGAELLFYCLTVALGWELARRRGPDLLYPCGVLLALCAFTLLHGQTPFWENLGMYALQGASGFIDFFSVALILADGDVVGRAGEIMGFTCLGLLGGELISALAHRVPATILTVAHFILPFSLLVLYFGGKHHHPASATPGLLLPARSEPLIPEALDRILAPKERQVLEVVMTGKSFSETALLVGVSTSSVKTYMRRIYQKTATTSREELLRWLAMQLDDERRREPVA